MKESVMSEKYKELYQEILKNKLDEKSKYELYGVYLGNIIGLVISWIGFHILIIQWLEFTKTETAIIWYSVNWFFSKLTSNLRS